MTATTDRLPAAAHDGHEPELAVPYLLIGSSGFDVVALQRPLLELVDDHPDECRCSFGPSAVQRGYPHHLIPAAEPWTPKGRRRA